MEQAIRSICRQVERLLQEKQTVLVAIDGSCTAGKSTLAAALARELDCTLFRMDDFFLRPEQRTPQRLAEPGGNVDYERFREEVLLPLKAGTPVAYRPYDCGTGGLKEPVAVTPKRINIIEGTYSHHPYFGDVYDLKVFTDIEEPEQLENIRARNGEEKLAVFVERWIPKEEAYFQKFRIKEQSDIVVEWRKNR